jgi:2-methylcitrate dehydratase PrpD
VNPTAELTQALTSAYAQGLPDPVRREAARSLINVLGTAIGAARSPASDAVVRYAAEQGSATTCPLPGRAERVDPLTAALTFGLAAHYDDFDDTHLETVIHPGAATAGASLAFAAARGATGPELLSAFALGCEAQLRLGVAMSPSHYDAGWHITGTCGVVGAAVATGLLAGFGADDLAQAVGVAASHSVGVREAFGTMTKPFHPGKAAANGLLSTLLVEAGMTGPAEAIAGERGFFDVMTEEPPERLLRLTAGLGEDWQLLRNTYKPYPCGIVIHPAIDAAVDIAPELEPDDIARVVVRCHPLVPELTGNPDPQDGLEARFSTIHGVAAGLVDGEVGLPQYDDDRVRRSDLVAMRARVELRVDDEVARDAAILEIERTDGSTERSTVEHARGSLARPLSDEELRAKVERLVEPVLPGATARLYEVVADFVAGHGDADDLLQATVPALTA